ncbi:hypothetical protein ABPG77_009787 [Micractinium sp. CCAP 211/92]
MGPEQRRDMEKGLSGGSQHVPEGPEGYSALPESAAQGIARASARSSQQGGHDGNQSQAQRIAAEVQEEEDELCDHVHHSNRAPWLRALVLGANDGLVSTAALMMGVGGGTADLATLRLAGVAGMVGGALSMAVGEYISVSSQRDAEKADIEKERQEQLKGPEAQARELEELAQIYVGRGLPYDLARQVAEVLTEKDVIRAHARDELGIDIDELANPLQAAIVSALCFTVGAALPLLSAAWVADANIRLGVLAGATTAGLCLFGFLGAWLGGANVLRGGTRVVLGGWLALGIVYGIGRALSVDSAA